jgi:hypothetical protein
MTQAGASVDEITQSFGIIRRSVRKADQEAGSVSFHLIDRNDILLWRHLPGPNNVSDTQTVVARHQLADYMKDFDSRGPWQR